MPGGARRPARGASPGVSIGYGREAAGKAVGPPRVRLHVGRATDPAIGQCPRTRISIFTIVL
ncbi:hypothetical protein OJJOAM_001057 [Cupriavidus sp. H18C1]